MGEFLSCMKCSRCLSKQKYSKILFALHSYAEAYVKTTHAIGLAPCVKRPCIVQVVIPNGGLGQIRGYMACRQAGIL